jgi:hypothetical protein
MKNVNGKLLIERPLTAKQAEKNEVYENAFNFLKKNLKPGSTVYHTIKSVSASGMSRQISFFIVSDNRITNIDWYISHVLDYRRNPKNGALKVSGCGMDMGFHVVYSLGRKLFPSGFKLTKGQYGRNGDRTGFDKDGGYSLHSEWI